MIRARWWLFAAATLVTACSNDNTIVDRMGSGTGGTAGGDAGAPNLGLGGGEIAFTPGGSLDEGYRTDKVDLLFVIDNSISMADKQQILAETVPDLIGRMAMPDCLTSDGGRVGQSNAAGECPAGSELEFKPVTDIHIGIISSSLGGHGSSDFCTPGAPGYNETQQDMARLLNRKRGTGSVATFQDLGFLAWDPAAKYGGDTDLTAIKSKFSDLVLGVGEQGCGFEAPLEAAYRFLIDPDPYDHIELENEGTPPIARLVGTDTAILEQRKNFLRPDSLLAIFSITDENDCSLVEGAQYYAALQNRPLWRATSQCASNPNDPCCQSCAQTQTNASCPDPATDTECERTTGQYDSAIADPINLRCYNQKQRFGIDMLYPIERYVAGVENLQIVDRNGTVAPNPIYTDLQCDGTNCKPARPRSFVFWVGIVGVPWQDIAVDPTNLGMGLMSAEQMHELARWSVIVGDATASPPVPPTDPLMIESVGPRSGTNPVTGVSTASPSSAQGENPVNGHEYLPWAGADLQYACIFPLATPRDCADVTVLGSCDCVIPEQPAAAIEQTKNPLCQAVGSTTTDTVQRFAKAYPGTRILRVLQALEPTQAVVGSICPANLEDQTAPDYGYRPVVPPLMDQLRTQLVIR